MIENILIRKQTPSEGMWLYRLIDNLYIIRKQVYLGKNDTEWAECIEAEKAEFDAHNKKVREEMKAKMNEQ